jgi:hypothetical protein
MTATRTTAIEIRTIASKAIEQALTLNYARKTYLEVLNDIQHRLDRASAAVEEAGRYARKIGEKAGAIVQTLARLPDNMRLDLLVKYAAEAQAAEAILDILMPQLTEEEAAQVHQILDM